MFACPSMSTVEYMLDEDDDDDDDNEIGERNIDGDIFIVSRKTNLV